MTTTTSSNGRLCNQIIRNLAVSLIAEKNDLQVTYSSNDLIERIGIPLFNGTRVHQNTIHVNDDQYMDVYNCNNVDYNLDPNNYYYQSKDIITIIYNYLQTQPIMSRIIEKNPYKCRYNANNDLFIHIRLSDAAIYNPGSLYYINTIKRVSDFTNLYIATDSLDHNISIEIKNEYPLAKWIHYDEVETIQFASTCKNIILSHGSFSAVIGYLSFYSNIYYPEYEPGKIWYGDMFSIDGWNKCKCA